MHKPQGTPGISGKDVLARIDETAGSKATTVSPVALGITLGSSNFLIHSHKLLC